MTTRRTMMPKEATQYCTMKWTNLEIWTIKREITKDMGAKPTRLANHANV